MTRTGKSASHQRGSTNVYADLGYKSADEMLVKAQLVTTIAEILAERLYPDESGRAPWNFAAQALEDAIARRSSVETFISLSERRLSVKDRARYRGLLHNCLQCPAGAAAP